MNYIPLAHFESKYLINEHGDILSLKDNSIKNTNISKNGYVHVHLMLNGKREEKLLHRLVALHFLPNPYGHPQVNHIDGDKTNNDISNLEWCSREQNIQHSLETGLRKGFMSLNDKRKYLKEVFQGAIVSDIAERIGRHPNTLSKMLRDTADKDGVRDQWNSLMKKRRKDVAIRNLKKVKP